MLQKHIDIIMYVTYSDVQKCAIQIHQSNTKRFRCFDVQAPFIGLFHRFFCTTHNNSFRITQPHVLEVIHEYPATMMLYLLPRTIVTPAFVELVPVSTAYIIYLIFDTQGFWVVSTMF